MRKILLGAGALTLSLLPIAGVVSCATDKGSEKKNQISRFKDGLSKDGSIEATKAKEAINCGKSLEVKKSELLKYFNIPTLDKGFFINQIEAEVDSTQKNNLKVKVFIKNNNVRSNSKQEVAEFTIRGFKEPVIPLTKIDINSKPQIWSSEFTKLFNDYNKTGISNSDKVKILNKIFSGVSVENFNQVSVEATNNKFTLKAIPNYTFGEVKTNRISSLASKTPKESKGELTGAIVDKNFENSEIWKDKTILTMSDLDGYSSIGENAFWNKYGITKITIPNSVTIIKKGAFTNLSLSGNLNIPDSVIMIGDEAFRNTGITSLTIGNSLMSIGKQAFSYNKLTTLTIPDSVVSIDDSAFFDNQLTEVRFGISIVGIGHYAFADNNFASDPQLPNKISSERVFKK